MNNSRDFIFCQMYILFAFGLIIAISAIVNCVDMKKDGTIIHLSWSDSKLIANTVEQKGKTASNVHLPAELRPLFFQQIPINDADYNLLLTVPGIGPKLALEIKATRERIGRFESAEDLLFVSGIGQKKKTMFKKKFSFE